MCGLKADWGLYRFMTKLIKMTIITNIFLCFISTLLYPQKQTYDLRIKNL